MAHNLFDKSILTFENLLKQKYSNYITREKLNAVIDIFDFSKIVISIVGNINIEKTFSTINNIIDLN